MSGRKLAVVTGGLAIAVMFLAVAAVAVLAVGSPNIARARQIAVRLQAEAMANPRPIDPPALAGASVVGGATTVATPPAAPTPPIPSAHPSKATATTGVSSPPPSTTTVSTAPPGISAPARAISIAALRTPASAVATRRQPTSAEIAQAIAAVNSAVPFFTPTPEQIASAGNQVCTALDQGQSFAQVKATALDMVGAGSYSWAVPSSVTDVAVRTVVALYCPGNAAKLV